MWQMQSGHTSPRVTVIDAMETEEEAQIYSIWVDWKNRVISFQKAEGFEKLEYPSHEEMFAFAIEKGFAGFGIQ